MPLHSQYENAMGMMMVQSSTGFLAAFAAFRLLDNADRRPNQTMVAVDEWHAFTELIVHQGLPTVLKTALLVRIFAYLWTSFRSRIQ